MGTPNSNEDLVEVTLFWKALNSVERISSVVLDFVSALGSRNPSLKEVPLDKVLEGDHIFGEIVADLFDSMGPLLTQAVEDFGKYSPREFGFSTLATATAKIIAPNSHLQLQLESQEQTNRTPHNHSRDGFQAHENSGLQDPQSSHSRDHHISMGDLSSVPWDGSVDVTQQHLDKERTTNSVATLATTPSGEDSGSYREGAPFFVPTHIDHDTKQNVRDDSYSIRLQPVNDQGIRMISPRFMASTLQAWIRGHTPDFAPGIVDVRRNFKGEFFIQFEPADWAKVNEILQMPNGDGLTISLKALGNWKRLPQVPLPLKGAAAFLDDSGEHTNIPQGRQETTDGSAPTLATIDKEAVRRGSDLLPRTDSIQLPHAKELDLQQIQHTLTDVMEEIDEVGNHTGSNNQEEGRVASGKASAGDIASHTKRIPQRTVNTRGTAGHKGVKSQQSHKRTWDSHKGFKDAKWHSQRTQGKNETSATWKRSTNKGRDVKHTKIQENTGAHFTRHSPTIVPPFSPGIAAAYGWCRGQYCRSNSLQDDWLSQHPCAIHCSSIVPPYWPGWNAVESNYPAPFVPWLQPFDLSEFRDTGRPWPGYRRRRQWV
ncbi:hypothetical protein BSKO_06239 [Bryopsis sp. KO-2023]|nr:hypothetical protein BSKO_06239 [Bryopsis sp. KO-2023]